MKPYSLVKIRHLCYGIPQKTTCWTNLLSHSSTKSNPHVQHMGSRVCFESSFYKLSMNVETSSKNLGPFDRDHLMWPSSECGPCILCFLWQGFKILVYINSFRSGIYRREKNKLPRIKGSVSQD
jgi:hypothetical protein